MSGRNPLFRLKHMRDYANKAIALCRDKNKADLEHDEVFRWALIHLIEIVGEAASKCPEEIQLKYPQIPWRKVISMRNRLIHGYDSIDNNILWKTVTGNLPILIAELEKIIPQE